jgi:hypothetical protein
MKGTDMKLFELAYRTRAENIAAVLFAALTIIGG